MYLLLCGFASYLAMTNTLVITFSIVFASLLVISLSTVIARHEAICSLVNLHLLSFSLHLAPRFHYSYVLTLVFLLLCGFASYLAMTNTLVITFSIVIVSSHPSLHPHSSLRGTKQSVHCLPYTFCWFPCILHLAPRSYSCVLTLVWVCFVPRNDKPTQ